ncbi:uncharacterized protein LOC108328468 [Vigna angularis]|uniref:uncharacterized protein LOC108328468 n=1 Tax=Phaseolus angularis TaxID=3914 RepID=UPI0022B2E107|nr:uncharacterized protein LOC108328468 [Vigna angularis]
MMMNENGSKRCGRRWSSRFREGEEPPRKKHDLCEMMGTLNRFCIAFASRQRCSCARRTLISPTLRWFTDNTEPTKAFPSQFNRRATWMCGGLGSMIIIRGF